MKKLSKVLVAMIGSGALLGAVGCATAMPSPELLSARDAYQRAEAGPAAELNPADLHDAKVLLTKAEEASRDDAQSAETRHRAYLAERRAELADSQGKTSAAIREKDASMKKLQAMKDASLVATKAQLADANANQQRTDAKLAQTEGQLRAEHNSRVEMHGQLAKASEKQELNEAQLADAAAAQQKSQAQLADAAAAQQKTQAELADASAAQQRTAGQLADASASNEKAREQLDATKKQLDSEHTARLGAEQDAEAALRKVAAVRQEARGMVITLAGNVLFASGKSEQLPSAQRRLDVVADALKKGDRHILIEGHSDSRGPASLNQQLSEARAKTVLEYLVAHDVPRERIRAVGKGSAVPAAENTTASGRASNRRVEIVLEKAGN